MWYYRLLFPLLFSYNFFIILFYIKTNVKKLTFYQFFKVFQCTVTFIKLNNNYSNILACYLGIFINIYEILPLSFMFYFRYRNKRYLELCMMHFKILRNHKIFFRLISELILFLIRKIKIMNIKLDMFYAVVNLKQLNYYNKFNLHLKKNLFFNLMISLNKIYFLNTSNNSVLLNKFYKLLMKFLKVT